MKPFDEIERYSAEEQEAFIREVFRNANNEGRGFLLSTAYVIGSKPIYQAGVIRFKPTAANTGKEV